MSDRLSIEAAAGLTPKYEALVKPDISELDAQQLVNDLTLADPEINEFFNSLRSKNLLEQESMSDLIDPINQRRSTDQLKSENTTRASQLLFQFHYRKTEALNDIKQLFIEFAQTTTFHLYEIFTELYNGKNTESIKSFTDQELSRFNQTGNLTARGFIEWVNEIIYSLKSSPQKDPVLHKLIDKAVRYLVSQKDVVADLKLELPVDLFPEEGYAVVDFSAANHETEKDSELAKSYTELGRDTINNIITESLRLCESEAISLEDTLELKNTINSLSQNEVARLTYELKRNPGDEVATYENWLQEYRRLLVTELPESLHQFNQSQRSELIKNIEHIIAKEIEFNRLEELPE
jgi:hypothetical protein